MKKHLLLNRTCVANSAAIEPNTTSPVRAALDHMLQPSLLSRAHAAKPALPSHAWRRQRQTERAVQTYGGLSYKQAGVDIDAGNELVNRIKKLNPSIGGFSGLVPFGCVVFRFIKHACVLMYITFTWLCLLKAC